jgi:hypothetical protein
MSQAHVQTRTPLGYTRALTGHRFALLFVFQLFNLILYPYTDRAGFRYYAFRALTFAVILLSIYAVSFRRSLVILAVLLGAPSLVQRVVFLRVEPSVASLLSTSLSLVFDVFVVVVIFRHVFGHERPNSETIFGALCIYLLIGFSFARIYEMVTAVQPSAFYLDPLTNLHKVPDRFDFVYFSFGSMTCLGTAGITPVSNQARSLCIIEAILGILYLAVLISRLMAAYRLRYDR